MKVDYLIIGQGICGTMLSWFLRKEGKTFLVMDAVSNSSSRVAAGIINPVTGRRYAYSWMIEEVMPFALSVYEDMGSYLQSPFIFRKSIIDFFPTPQARQVFVDRISENDTYLHPFPDQNHFNQYFNYDFGCGEISPACIVHLSFLLLSWREWLQEQQHLREEEFEPKELKVSGDGIRYHDIEATKIIFCDGATGAQNPWFKLLPYAPNKGELLIIESEELINNYIFKRGLMLAPLREKNTFWVGSNYQWEFEDEKPSERFFKQTTAMLGHWIKKPFRVLDHKAAVRPATIERRPFVGVHPHYPSIGILNGMGTKGTSLAPYFANQLVQHLVHGLPITPEAEVQRFRRILSR